MNTLFTFEPETFDYVGGSGRRVTGFQDHEMWEIGSPDTFQYEGGVPAAPMALPAASAPKGLALLQHMHIRATCSTAGLVRDTAPIVMKPANMNSGFIGADNSIVFDSPLQTDLANLMVTKYKTLLARQSIANRQASKDDRIRVALVDLTGDKLCRPGYAGWGSTMSISGASTAKIAIFYTAAQLLCDVRHLVKAKSIATTAALLRETDAIFKKLSCKPDMRWLFKFDESVSPLGVKVNPKFSQGMLDIVEERSSTPNASELIMRIGFDYVASVMWQSGLRHPSRAGLWLGSTYCTGRTKAPANRNCHDFRLCPKLRRGRFVWKSDPLGLRSIVLNALSAATFMTLLAQGRLVAKAPSDTIERFLARACTWFPMALPNATVRAAKCGLTSNLLHDVGLIENGGRRYAVAYLTQGANKVLRANADKLLMELIKDLDQLIAANNP